MQKESLKYLKIGPCHCVEFDGLKNQSLSPQNLLSRIPIGKDYLEKALANSKGQILHVCLYCQTKRTGHVEVNLLLGIILCVVFYKEIKDHYCTEKKTF